MSLKLSCFDDSLIIWYKIFKLFEEKEKFIFQVNLSQSAFKQHDYNKNVIVNTRMS
jgi:hypothetical protein